MAIRVAPGAADVPGDLGGRFLVLVRHAGESAAALAALEAARAELAGIGPAMVSPVVRSPAGPLLRVGSIDADEEGLRSIPSLVVAALARHGVDDVVVDLLEPVGPLDALDHTPDAAVLRAFPPPAGRSGVVPLEWLEVAADWVLADADPETPVAVRLLGGPFELLARDAMATLHAALVAGAWCDLVHGDLGRRIRTASLTFGHAPHLALAAGGPACDESALLARFSLLGEVARELKGAAYVCVDIEPTFAGIGTGLSGDGWTARGGAAPNAVAAQVGDLVVPDVYPLQVLGPGHLARLADRDDLPVAGTPLDDGRMLVTLGDPADWLPHGDGRENAIDLGSAVLGPLLVTDAELAHLVRGRPAPVEPPAAATGGWLDLDHIDLEPLPHARRGLRLTLLELAAWLGYEPHSDTPASVSPVLACYARWYASTLDDDERQGLKRYALRLVGTRDPGLPPLDWRPLGVRDQARAWLAAEWIARVQAPAWLRAAGHDRLADELAGQRPAPDGGHRNRLLAILDRSATALHRARSRTASDIAWDVWERAADRTGWIAASEAAWVGVPDPVASAAELHAAEIARSTDRSLDVPWSTAVRQAALDAAAADAWRLAGAAATAAVDGYVAGTAPGAYDTAVPLATAWERSVQGAAGRTGRDRDEVEATLEEAQAAAVAGLAQLIDRGESPADALQRACTVAARADGPDWGTVTELACGVVGEQAWEAGITAASTTVHRIVQVASPVIERAVLVSLARETCGLAARAAVDARGPDALDRAIAVLRPEAHDLLDALIDLG